MGNLGRYALVRKVGAGGMAEVWKARVQGPAGFHKTLAIKRILPSFNERAELIDMLVEEAKLVARLQHPNIVQVFDFGSVSGVEDVAEAEWGEGDETGDYYIAMEYVAGQNLARILNRLARRKIQCSPDIAMFIVAEVARGLAHAHSEGDAVRIIHRDISPHNILISYSGAVKITDFGIAKVENALSRTATGQLKGKLAYMSPEQVTTGKIDHRTDLFALGAVMFELLTMDALFRGDDAAGIFRMISSFAPENDERISVIAPELRPLVLRALQPEPGARYQDGHEMERAVAAVLGSARMLLARRSLVSLMRVVFSKEHQREKAEDEAVDAAARGDAGAGAPPPVAAEPEPSGDDEADGAPNTTYFSVPAREDGSAPSITVETLMPEAGAAAEEQGPLPDPFAGAPQPAADPGEIRPWDEDSKARQSTAGITGANCANCNNLVETFLGDSELCFACLDEEDAHAAPDTSYQAVMPATGPGLSDQGLEVQDGFLTIGADSTVEVWIDGERTGSTPLRQHPLSPGDHHIVLINGGASFRREEKVKIVKGAEINLFVDVQSKTLRRW